MLDATFSGDHVDARSLHQEGLSRPLHEGGGYVLQVRCDDTQKKERLLLLLYLRFKLNEATLAAHG